MNAIHLELLRKLDFWSGPIEATDLSGGITNVNYLVQDNNGKYVARLGSDIPVHQVMRFNELAASRAAHAAGISPAVRHFEPGVLILDYVDSRTLAAEHVQDQATLERILPLVKACHRDIPRHLRGPVLTFWVFHVVRDYAATLRDGGSSHISLLSELLTCADRLEQASSPIDLVFGHNDLLPANFLDDGTRLWLIDWDYAGFNSPLFDLGGLASNNQLSEAQESWLLETYFEQPVTAELLHRYSAMKCASLLRETMWSMVSEIHSDLAFDYAAYTAENLAGFRASYELFRQS
ncbi:phosphotransferase [Pararhizobium sp. IMCC21322]|uniref:phosphotransferase n=1 Tax=Pararhizobium sp. IMCC21322 TaxID=3067903 RepID=UPI00274216DE|nr:phosphotransferase [Pararhizobium sp. IMCC21322]